MVKMMMPTTVKQATEKAKLQELTLEVIFNKYTIATEIQPSFYPLVEGNQVNVNSKVYPTLMQPNHLLWSRDEVRIML